MKVPTLLLVSATLSLSLFPTVTRAEANSGDIRFPHDVHAEAEVDCRTCHEAAWTSTGGTDPLLPAMDDCSQCHDVDEDCGLCHRAVEEPSGYAPRDAKADRFPHARHLEQGMSCGRCHGPASAPEAHPAMADCRSCHATAPGLQDCGVCHTQGAALVPESHERGWRWFHGVEAGLDAQSCASCHTQTDCQDCHTGDDVRPRVHRLNFDFDHSVEARAQEVECSTCHEQATFCAACHASRGVRPLDHDQSGWVGSDGGRHAIEAAYGMEGCVACHDAGEADPVCADCHGP